MKTFISIGVVAVSVFGVGLLAGCGAEGIEAEQGSEENLGSVSEELGSSTFLDSSGKVQIRIKMCPWVGPASNPSATCDVDADYVLVGGGAQIEGNGNAGALLTESSPDSNLGSWRARSKDHVDVYKNRLRAFAIGLRLKNSSGQWISPATLKNSIVRRENLSPGTSHQPQAVAELPPGYKLIGGGAQAHWSTKGLLLTQSYPDGFNWVAEAKDHVASEMGSVSAFAIGIADTIPNFGSLDVSVNNATVWSGSGYATASVEPPSNFVLTSIGGYADWNVSGRLLTDMMPLFDLPNENRMGAWITTKDHKRAATGNTTAYTIGVKKH